MCPAALREKRCKMRYKLQIFWKRILWYSLQKLFYMKTVLERYDFIIILHKKANKCKFQNYHFRVFSHSEGVKYRRPQQHDKSNQNWTGMFAVRRQLLIGRISKKHHDGPFTLAQNANVNMVITVNNRWLNPLFRILDTKMRWIKWIKSWHKFAK